MELTECTGFTRAAVVYFRVFFSQIAGTTGYTCLLGKGSKIWGSEHHGIVSF